MPIVIAVDVSLSMSRPISTASNSMPAELNDEQISTRKKLAVDAINQFLDHISTDCKLEFVSLVRSDALCLAIQKRMKSMYGLKERLYFKQLTFSSVHRIDVDFLREVDNIRTALLCLEEFDKTNYDSMLKGVTAVVTKTWTSGVSTDIVLITDGCSGSGLGSLRDVIEKAQPFPFPAKMNVLCLSDPHEKNFTENCQMLQRLIEVTAGEGLVYLPENHLNLKGCSSAVSKLCAKEFVQYQGSLTCGQLFSKITLCPGPRPYVSRMDEKRYDVSNTVKIIGFIDINDLATPAAYSRHLLLPLKSADNTVQLSRAEQTVPDDDTDGNVPNFCVLLHGALKVEGMSAICEVGQNWYGFIFSWADNKKKSNLMLSILPPGVEMIPWLGKMDQLGPRNELPDYTRNSGSLSMAGEATFPVKPVEKKSYGSNPTVWMTEEGLLSDVQKLLRHAKKMPDKTAQFYKELNRMRRWALSLGFEAVLDLLAVVLERECIVSSLPAETTIQLTHAAQQLRAVTNYNKQIAPHTRQIR